MTVLTHNKPTHYVILTPGVHQLLMLRYSPPPPPPHLPKYNYGQKCLMINIRQHSCISVNIVTEQCHYYIYIVFNYFYIESVILKVICVLQGIVRPIKTGNCWSIHLTPKEMPQDQYAVDLIFCLYTPKESIFFILTFTKDLSI